MASAKAVLHVVDSECSSRRFKLAAQGTLVATWAAVCWVVLGVESIVHPQQVDFRDAVWMIPCSLTAAAFVYLHLLQRSREAMLEAIGFYAVMIASLLAFLGNVGVLTNFPLLAKFGFPWGALLLDGWFDGLWDWDMDRSDGALVCRAGSDFVGTGIVADWVGFGSGSSVA
jgi:hypothetical protein